MDRISGIYCIHNTLNGKKYIGQSNNIYFRWYSHKRDLNKNIHCNIYLQRAWNKYGENCFNFYILEECEKDSLNERELYYINSLHASAEENGYNLTHGGDNNKIELTDQYKKILHEAHRNEFIPINMYSDNGDFIMRFDNMADAAKHVNGTESGVRNCANSISGNYYAGKRYKGYCWVFDEDVAYFENLDFYDFFSLSKFKVNKYEYPSGKFICQYRDIKSAADDNKVSIDVISMCVRKVQNKSGNYTYRNADKEDGIEDIYIEKPKQRIVINPVVAFDIKTGKVFNAYINAKEAVNLGDIKSTSHVTNCCLGKRHTAHGYKWKYLKDIDILELSDQDSSFLMSKFKDILN